MTDKPLRCFDFVLNPVLAKHEIFMSSMNRKLYKDWLEGTQ